MDQPTTSLPDVIKNFLYLPTFLVGMEMQSFTILIVFIMLDMITGIWRVAVIEGGHEIKSAKAINGLVSKMLFALIPLIVAYTGKGIGVDLTAFASGCLSLLIVSTAYSAIGNIYTIRSGKTVAEFDAVRLILNGMKRLLDNMNPPNDKI